MSLTIACPSCQAKYRLPDGSEGKKVKCQKCGERFTVSADGDADERDVGITPAAPAPRPSKKTVPADDEGDDDLPRRRRRSEERDEDDADEDRPRRRRKKDEDEDEDDDRPRRRRKKRKEEGSNAALIIGGLVLGVFVLCGGGAGIVVWSFTHTVKKVGQEVEKQFAAAEAQMKAAEAQQKLAVAGDGAKDEARFFAVGKKLDIRGQGIPVVFDGNGTFTHANVLTNNDPLVGGGRFKLYEVDLVAGKNYRLEMSSGQIDPFLLVLAADGQIVAQDDDSGDGPNGLDALIVFQATSSGKHRIIATTFNLANEDNAQGPYTLIVRRDAAGPVAGGPPPGPGMPRPGVGRIGRPGQGLNIVGAGTPVTLGADGTFTQANKLAAGDPMSQGKHYKVYSLTMEPGRSYEIGLNSGQFDSYLYLLAPNNQVVAFDDDSGGALNSLIRYTAPAAGVYRIVATSLAPGQGDFTLAVRRQ